MSSGDSGAVEGAVMDMIAQCVTIIVEVKDTEN